MLLLETVIISNPYTKGITQVQDASKSNNRIQNRKTSGPGVYSERLNLETFVDPKSRSIDSSCVMSQYAWLPTKMGFNNHTALYAETYLCDRYKNKKPSRKCCEILLSFCSPLRNSRMLRFIRKGKISRS